MMTFEQQEAEQMKNPAFRVACVRIEPRYQHVRARLRRAAYLDELRQDPEYRKAERRLWLVLLLDDVVFYVRRWLRR